MISTETKNKDILSEMYKGDKSYIMMGLTFPTATIRTNAIMNAVWNNYKDPATYMKLSSLEKDNAIICGYYVSDFAKAALDIMGFKKYTGNDVRIKKLIESNFEFGQELWDINQKTVAEA